MVGDIEKQDGFLIGVLEREYGIFIEVMDMEGNNNKNIGLTAIEEKKIKIEQ